MRVDAYHKAGKDGGMEMIDQVLIGRGGMILLSWCAILER